jgi:acetolactate synthase-1/2/3 large subunit
VAGELRPAGGPVSLILPADSAWLETKTRPVIAQKAVRPAPSGEAVEAAAAPSAPRKRPVLLLGGQACRAEALGPGRPG